MKVDVEGAEQQVFQGALETLKRTRPLIVFEHTLAGSSAYDTGPRDLYALLVDEVDLRIFDLNGNGPFGISEFERLSHQGDPINFVAHR